MAANLCSECGATYKPTRKDRRQDRCQKCGYKASKRGMESFMKRPAYRKGPK